MSKKVAVILAGCGRLDGSEIHESVLTLLAIKECGGNYQCISLDLLQNHVTNHITNQNVSHETRNMLIESARIARGDVKAIDVVDINEYDALIIPGGNGISYNLFDYAVRGTNFTVNEKIKNICLAFTNANKPIGFICIAPLMIPKIYKTPINLTIGNDVNLIKMLTEEGMIHHTCTVNEICIDKKYNIYTTPAYMLGKDILDVYTGISKLIKAILC